MPLRLLSPLVALLLLASADPAIALTDDQRRCQAEVGRQGKRLFKDVTKALRKCEIKVAKGNAQSGTDCTLEPSAAAKIAKSAQRFTDNIGARCDDALVASIGWGGDCIGSEKVAELVACQIAVHQDRATELVNAMFGTTGLVNASRRKCQAKTATEAAKVASRRQDLMRKCRDNVAQQNLPDLTDCTVYIEPLLANTRSKALAKIPSVCSDAQASGLTWGGACEGVDTALGLASCAVGSHEQGVDGLLVAEYGNLNGGAEASVAVITDTADCIEGPLSRCKMGDYRMANGEVQVVIQDVGRNMLAVGQYGGQIIDADLVRTGLEPERDHFEEFAFALNIENGARYTNLTVINDGSDGQAAVLRATGVDDLLDFVNPSSVVVDFGFPFPAAADDTDLPVDIVTDYSLQPGDNFVGVKTTVTNTSASPVDMWLGAYFAPSGQVETFQGGYGFGEPLVATRCPNTASNPCGYLAFAAVGDAEGVSYGWIHDEPLSSSSFSTSGVAVPLLGTETIFALIGVAPQNYSLAAAGSPGDSVTINQHFIIGDGTVSSVLEARNEVHFVPTGTIEGVATVGGVPTEGVRVVAFGDVAGGPSLGPVSKNVVNHTLSDALGQYSLQVGPGSYTVAAELEGHPYEGGGSTPLEHAVDVVAYQTSTQNIAIPEAGAIDVTITDESSSPIAARITVVGFDPSENMLVTQGILGQVNNTTGVFRDNGQDTNLPHGVAAVFFVDQTGLSGVRTLEPGDYRLYVSHGPEYSVATADVTVTAGATTPVAVQIARVIDTTGFISGDFHVHSIDSPDSKVARKDRIVAMLAEDVNFFTPTDHETIQDFSADIAALGASSLIGTAPGTEITTFDYGHFNAWPITRDPSQPNGGGLDHGGAAPVGMDFPQYSSYSLTPAQIIAAAHADPGTDTVQINHFYSQMGLTSSGLAIDTGMVPPQSNVPGTVRRLDPAVANYFTDTFDALEIFISSSRGQIFNNFYGRNLGDWFNLLNQGYTKTAVADSDTHRRITTLSGIPRTMVASPTDDPGALSALADTLSANVNAGRATGTNTPYMKVTTSAASTGETGGLELGLPLEIATADGAVDVTVEIQSPLWAEFDTVEFYVNSVTTRSIEQVNSGDPSVDPVDVMRYSVTPDFTHTAGTDFTVSTVVVDPGVPGASRLEATTTLNLTGLTSDVWIVAIVRGTDGVSRPLFPVVPFNLDQGSNTTLANLIDGNLGEAGVPALAYSNPLFVDANNDGSWTPPGVAFIP